jgi:NADPH:quinone reductase-like Zn-dependent oxidoreductase
MAKIVQYTEFGGPDVLEVVEVPTPTPADDRVVVEVHAAGINPIDGKLRQGIRPSDPITTPRRLGLDAAGTIVAVGSAIDGWKVGDDVIIRGANGGYASHVAASGRQLVAKLDGVGWEQAAALGVPVGTAYQAVRSLGVTEGTNLLIHGGSGSVGQAAIQFAVAWGASVIATASEANLDRLRELGATAVAYGPGLLDRLREVAPDGVDAVLDAAGTDEALEASFALVDDRSKIGTIVVGARAASLGIRAWSGGSPEPLTDEQQAWRTESATVVQPLIVDGSFDIEIDRAFPLDDVVEAVTYAEQQHPRGKVILLP